MWVTFDWDGAVNSHRMWIKKPRRKGRLFVGEDDERGWVILERHSFELARRELKPGECVEAYSSDVVG